MNTSNIASYNDNTKAGFYCYDANGERVYKLTGTSSQTHTPQHDIAASVYFDNAVIYPNPYVVITDKGYTKHYYANSERLATVFGQGGWMTMSSNFMDNLTLYEEGLLFNLFFRYKGTSRPYGQPIISDVPNWDIDEHDIQEVQYDCESIDLVELAIEYDKDILAETMLEYKSPQGSEKDVYYTHNDHLGSAAWITDQDAKPVQYLHYLPYGQLLANQSPSGYDERYKFIGKERDWESGYDYFGARYYIAPFLHWMSVDPLVDRYPGNTPYMYCLGNPLVYHDPDGRSTYTDVDGNVTEVRADNDLGVYKWNLQTEQYDLMGESWHPLSFCDQTKYNNEGIVTPQYIKIEFGSTELGDAINSALSENPTLLQYAVNAQSGGEWDLKEHYTKGSLVNGKYASPQDAGNMLAGAIKYRSGILAPIVQYGYGAYNLAGNTFWKAAALIIGNMGVMTQCVPVGISAAALIYNGEDILTQRSINNGYKHIR